jgi:cell shape-determining protein MreD
MRNIVAFPLLGLAVIMQSAVVSQVKLLAGHADLILVLLAAWALQERVKSAWHWAATACLLLAVVSRMPWLVLGVGYLGVVYLAQALQKRVWQAPLLAMFTVTFLGTLFIHLLSFGYLFVLGTSLPFEDMVGLVTLPSLLLNMLFSIPMYAMMRDLSRWVYPEEVNE